jgi:catechol 2,3-dioxygenase-like lactoylglutathione lyase family enzyme
MEKMIAKLVDDFARGKMNRRQLIQSLTITAASAAAVVPAAAAEARLIKAVNLNHVSFQVADYKRTRDFYADLFGMQVSDDDGKTKCRLNAGENVLVARTQPSNTPRVDHIGYTIANWDTQKGAIAAELKRRGLAIRIPENDTHESLHIVDPDGFDVQLGGAVQ